MPKRRCLGPYIKAGLVTEDAGEPGQFQWAAHASIGYFFGHVMNGIELDATTMSKLLQQHVFAQNHG